MRPARRTLPARLLSARAASARGRALLRRPSRTIGATLLAIGLALQLWAGDEGLAWRNPWFDLLHRLSPRERPADPPAVVVAIDEETMRANGDWPWPRDRLAVLVHRIGQLGASVVALDILLGHPDPQSPPRMAADYRALGFEAAATELERLGDTDEVLLHGLRTAPAVLPVAGRPALPPLDHGPGCDFPAPPVAAAAPLPPLSASWDDAEAPLPMLTRPGPGFADLGLGAVAFDSGQGLVLRRVPAVQRICGNLFLMLGAEALRAAAGTPAAVLPRAAGLEVVLGDPADPSALRFPTERDGTFWLHVAPLGDAEGVARRYLSAQSLFAPGIDPELLAGKIALLAVVDLGRIDERMSPLGEVIYGVEAHAQMIEQIVAGDFLRRPGLMRWLEAALLLLGGLAVLAVVPALRPARAVTAIAAGVLALVGAGWAAFVAGWLFDAATPAVGVAVVSAGVITATLIERDRARLVSEIALATARGDRAQLRGELDAAARMQRQFLPARRFLAQGVDLACHIEPALQVGGDFYDHVMLDDRHLFFLVADVSGKGADASQFMLLSKTLWKSVALRSGPPLATIQRAANAEITRENAALMFVTAIAGILDIETGRVAFSSAGHDAPFLFGNGREPVQPAIEAGPPAGLLDGVEFAVTELTLEPGDRLCLFSDGITEAMDGEGALFGIDRLRAALAKAPAAADSEAVLDHVLARVAAFTGDAEKSDDLTLMVLTAGGSVPPPAPDGRT